MNKLILASIIFLTGLFLLDQIMGQDPERRNWEYFPDMAESAAYKSQSPNPHFSNGRTQQSPVPGTIARGYMPLHYSPSVRSFVRAGNELTSPFEAENKPNLERARNVYQTYCQVCHGAEARGDGPVTKRGFPSPPSLLFGKALNMKNGHIFHIITYGFRNMPAYASQIKPEDRWLVIAYLRKLQGNQP